MKLFESDPHVVLAGIISSTAAVALVIVGLILAHHWK